MRPTPDKMRAFMAQLRKKMNLKSLVVTLAAIVVFTTTYLLILPAFTLDKEEAAEQGGIDIAVEQTVEEEAPAEKAEEPAAEQKESADTVKEAEEPAAKEEVKEDAASPKQKDSDAKDDKEEVKLLSKKKELTAEKAKKDDFTISAVVDKNSKVPEDVFLQATELTKDTKDFDYDKYYKDALKALKNDSGNVKGIKTIKFYDISLEAESQDESVEPKSAVDVKIEYEDGLKVKDADNIRIVHFAEKKNGEVKAEVIDDSKVETTVNAKSQMTETTFKTDGFSEFAVVEVETMETSVIAADGKTYKVSVTYGKDAGVPEGSRLEVSEVTGADAEPYLEKAASTLKKDADELSFAKFFDIKIMNGDDEVKIEKPVNVEINLLDNETLTDNTQVLHFESKEKADRVDSSVDGNTVKFEADGFSVYAVVEPGEGGDYARIKVNFYGLDPNNPVATYYVKNSDVLKDDENLDPDVVRAEGYSYIDDIVVDPGIGGEVPQGQTFLGWSMDDQMKPNGERYQDTDTYVGADYQVSTKPMTINQIREVLADMDIKEGDIVNIYAMIFKYYNITYYGDKANGEINKKVSLGTDTVYLLTNENEARYTVKQTYSADAHQNFKGWKPAENTAGKIKAIQKDEGGQESQVALSVYPNNTLAAITGDVVMYVEAPRGNWLVYDANARGATYNAPQFYLKNEETEVATGATVANMERNGYTLEERADGEPGWYKLKDEYIDEKGNPTSVVPRDDEGYLIISDTYFEPFTFGGLLTDNVTIYAKWVPKDTANYTIIFHRQNIDRTGYEMAGSYVGSGRVGDPIPFTFVNNEDEDYVTDAGGGNRHYTGFCLNHSEANTLGTLQKTTDYTTGGSPVKETVAIPTITPEGDAVLNIYYDRIEYEFRFYYYRERYNQISTAENSRTYTGNGVYGVSTWRDSDSAPNQTYGADHVASIRDDDQTTNTYNAHYFVLKAYYGQNIASMWPQYNQLGSVGNNQAVSFVMMNGTGLKKLINDAGTGTGRGSDTIKGTIEIMDEMILGKTNDADGNFVVIRYNTRNEWRYHIFYEQVAGVDYSGYAVHDYEFNGKLYYEDHIYNSRSTNQDVGQQTAPQFTGYKYVGLSNQTGQSGGTNGNDARWETTEDGTRCFNVRFYYDRLLYPVTFYDGNYVTGNNDPGTTDHNRASQLILEKDDNGNYISKEEVLIEHGAPIGDDVVNNYVPKIQPGEEGYVFEGWYLDEACSPGAEYNLTTMPIGGVTVYAKWRQIRYRVFLHSEAYIIDPDTGEPAVDGDGNKIYDDTLNWGSASQNMSFGVEYGGKVSLPEGTRDEYEFLGWFRDKECTQLYSASTVLNEETVPETPEYDKDVDFTDVLDKHGNVDPSQGTPSNSDVNRYWVTRKLDLYGKWRHIIVGSEGIGVVYDVGELGNEATKPIDTLLYKDDGGAVAQPACKPTDEDTYQFLYWVVQKWDPAAGEDGEGAYVDVTDENGDPIICTPGDSFTCKLIYAKQVENEGSTPENPSYTYTMQLRAEYGLKETEKPTHIDWYLNEVTPETPAGTRVSPDHRDTQQGLQINEHTYIWGADPTEAPKVNVPTRNGYTFVGWARVPTSVSNSDYKESVAQTKADLLGDAANDYLYLKYENGQFKLNDPSNPHHGKKVTEVAADEIQPYHDMYAVWEKKTYTVTVIKEVAEEADEDVPFTFKPIFKGVEGDDYSANFSLVGNKNGSTQGEVTYPHSKTFENVPYGTQFSITETPASYYTLDNAKYSVAGADDSSKNVQNQSYTNGNTLTVDGNTTITFNNKRNTYDITIKKTDEKGNDLSGAVFHVRRLGETGIYDKYMDDITIGSITTELITGNYQLIEESAPDAYIIMENDVKFTLNTDGTITVSETGTLPDTDIPIATASQDGDGNWTVAIKNVPGKPLPHTGGIGTTIFYVLGSLLVVGCGIMLVARRRMKDGEK